MAIPDPETFRAKAAEMGEQFDQRFLTELFYGDRPAQDLPWRDRLADLIGGVADALADFAEWVRYGS